jgi:hypothetical protein
MDRETLSSLNRDDAHLRQTHKKYFFFWKQAIGNTIVHLLKLHRNWCVTQGKDGQDNHYGAL